MNTFSPVELKYLGEPKAYTWSQEEFVKPFATLGLHEAELRGLEVARQSGLATIPVTGVYGTRIGFKRVAHSRLDQLFNRSNDLHLIYEAGALIARLHRSTEATYQPDLSIPFTRAVDMLIGLQAYGDLPNWACISLLTQVRALFSQYGKVQTSCYIHGDFIPQNIFVTEALILFDWEHSTYSDPVYDLAAFMSFMMQLVTKHAREGVLLIDVESKLLAGYRSERSLSSLDLERYAFYKIFDCHTMYWLYLFLLSEIAAIDPQPREKTNPYMTSNYDLSSVVKVLHAYGFVLKQSSLARILHMLKHNPALFPVHCPVKLEFATKDACS